MKIGVSSSDDITLVKPEGDIRVKTIIPLRKVFERFQDQGIKRIAIDLAKVNFIDSSGIGILLNFAKIQKECKGCLCLFNYSNDIKELLDIIDLGDFIPAYKTFAEMKQSLSG